MSVRKIGTFFINKIKPSVMKSVSAVINGISIIGFSVSKFSVKPKKPLSNDSKIII